MLQFQVAVVRKTLDLQTCQINQINRDLGRRKSKEQFPETIIAKFVRFTDIVKQIKVEVVCGELEACIFVRNIF